MELTLVDFYTFLSLPNILKNFFLVYLRPLCFGAANVLAFFTLATLLKKYFRFFFEAFFPCKRVGKDMMINRRQSSVLTKVFNIIRLTCWPLCLVSENVLVKSGCKCIPVFYLRKYLSNFFRNIFRRPSFLLYIKVLREKQG